MVFVSVQKRKKYLQFDYCSQLTSLLMWTNRQSKTWKWEAKKLQLDEILLSHAVKNSLCFLCSIYNFLVMSFYDFWTLFKSLLNFSWDQCFHSHDKNRFRLRVIPNQLSLLFHSNMQNSCSYYAPVDFPEIFLLMGEGMAFQYTFMIKKKEINNFLWVDRL